MTAWSLSVYLGVCLSVCVCAEQDAAPNGGLATSASSNGFKDNSLPRTGSSGKLQGPKLRSSARSELGAKKSPAAGRIVYSYEHNLHSLAHNKHKHKHKHAGGRLTPSPVEQYVGGSNGVGNTLGASFKAIQQALPVALPFNKPPPTPPGWTPTAWAAEQQSRAWAASELAQERTGIVGSMSTGRRSKSPNTASIAGTPETGRGVYWAEGIEYEFDDVIPLHEISKVERLTDGLGFVVIHTSDFGWNTGRKYCIQFREQQGPSQVLHLKP